MGGSPLIELRCFYFHPSKQDCLELKKPCQHPGFSLGRLHMGGFAPHMGGTSAGGQSVNGGTHEGA